MTLRSWLLHLVAYLALGVAADAALAWAQARYGPGIAYWFEWIVVVAAGYGVVLGSILPSSAG